MSSYSFFMGLEILVSVVLGILIGLYVFLGDGKYRGKDIFPILYVLAFLVFNTLNLIYKWYE